jgi:hypothetical protein
MAAPWLIAASIVIGAVGVTLALLVYRRRAHLWLGAYVKQALHGGPQRASCTTDIFVCIADHFEPAWLRPDPATESARIDAWLERYPRFAQRHRDADGRPPQHTFFYPVEQYRAEHLDKLARLCADGYGDVEIHLHHDNDTAENLRQTLTEFARVLHERHGLLHRDPRSGRIEYAFVHGDWALDNSAANGRCCGVNGELRILRETGCYADFTLPSAPSETQTRKINSIYYATGDPRQTKSHDTGVDVEVGREPSGDLMIVQGPLGLNWTSRRWGLVPRIENGELSADNPPSAARVDQWVRRRIHVKGRPEWVFIKLHTHGAQEHNLEPLLGAPRHAMLDRFETAYNDGKRFRLHYVTAREFYELIKLAESGSAADAGSYLTSRHDSRRRQHDSGA